jgi:hypothetical protein
MTRISPGDDRNRMVACRACGNRVPRAARRCPACGAREPGRDAPEAPVRREPPRRAGRRRRRVLLAVLAVVVVLAGAVVAAVVVWRPPEAPPLERRPEAPARRPDVSREPAPTAAESPPPSRSRGRADWIFFFKPGDRLVRMGDETPVGYVVRTENAHVFPDGQTGPAYVLSTPAGDEQPIDADELERTAKLQ